MMKFSIANNTRLSPRYLLVLAIASFLLFFTGCGSLTGIPGHGGGKRFAVEQELVSAATRATIKALNLETLRGKKINLYINAIDDSGSGNLIGGRFSLVSQIRGDYIHSPKTKEKSIFPHATTMTSTHSETSDKGKIVEESFSTGGSFSSSEQLARSLATSSTKSTTTGLHNAPEITTSHQKGGGNQVHLGAEYRGLGAYQNSEEISSSDLQYLYGLLQTYFFLKGVHIVPPSEAEIDIYVIVDVFGTVRTRVDWFLANNEILTAKTALEIIGVDHRTGAVILPPQSASVEAEYNEQYLLWAGPIKILKKVKMSQPLLADYSEVDGLTQTEASLEQDVTIPYPFQHQLDKMQLSNK